MALAAAVALIYTGGRGAHPGRHVFDQRVRHVHASQLGMAPLVERTLAARALAMSPRSRRWARSSPHPVVTATQFRRRLKTLVDC
jgi:hypothetical protein